LEALLAKAFARKGERVVTGNLQAARSGRDCVVEHTPGRRSARCRCCRPTGES